MTELPNTAGAWLRSYSYDNLFTYQLIMRAISGNLVTVTSVTWLQLRRHMVRRLHNYTVAWIRGYAVTKLCFNLFPILFSTSVYQVTP